MDSSALCERLVAAAQRYSVPGIQFAIRHGGTTTTWEYGVVRVGSADPITADSPVPAGSVTKVVTAAAALVLVADGDLELDAPLTRQLSEFRELRGTAAAEVTLRHLLSHTSGLPSDPAEVRAGTLRRHVLDCCRAARSLAAPSRVFSYSNIGYLLVGQAITAVTGMSWWEAVSALVLRPLGVRPRFVVGEAVPRDLVSGHSVRRDRQSARPVAQSLRHVEAPAGALAASAADLVRIGSALSDLERDTAAWAGSSSNEAFEQMRTPVPGADPFGLADGWGLGLASFGAAGHTVGHDGSGDGTSCHLRINSDAGTVLALTANAGSGFALWRAIAPELPGLGIPVGDYDALAVGDEPAAASADCSGDYANGEVVYTVSRADAGLHLSVDGEPFADLTHYRGGRFTMRDCDSGEVDQAGRFLTGADGRVLALQVGGRVALKQERIRSVA